jgi:SAM-dependent methyltransferase
VTADTDRIFAGSIPEVYERVLVPVLFRPYVAEMARRVADGAPRRVLEVAAGTGVLTRALAAALPAAEIVATDLNQPMLDAAPEVPGVSWRQADAQRLPFADGAFDAVACQFGVMFFPDRVAAYREAHRVLTPDGRFVFATWDGLAGNDFAAVMAGAVAGCFPDDPPSFAERIPHGYHDPRLIVRELREAGFARVELEQVAHPGRAPSAAAMAVGFCRGTPVGAEVTERDPSRLEEVVAAVESALRARFGTGEIEGTLTAHLGTAWP